MKDLAPVVLFVYNRPWHTRQTLEALKLNELAKDSRLYIFSDGPKKNSTEEELNKIKEVRSVLREESWCGEVKIIERNENLGLANSVISGVSEVINNHGRIIVLEDDIVTGRYFLKFMNDALYNYESEKKVFGVSGYKYPSVKDINAPTYFLPISSSWSFATWEDRWNNVNFDGRYLLDLIDSKNLKKRMNFGNYPFYEMLVDQVNGRNNSWAIRFYSSMVLCNGLFVYPNLSLVENIGFDSSGVHCGEEDFFSRVKKVNHHINKSKRNLKQDRQIVNSFKTCFERNYSKKINKANSNYKSLKRIIKNILNRFGLLRL